MKISKPLHSSESQSNSCTAWIYDMLFIYCILEFYTVLQRTGEVIYEATPVILVKDWVFPTDLGASLKYYLIQFYKVHLAPM